MFWDMIRRDSHDSQNTEFWIKQVVQIVTDAFMDLIGFLEMTAGFHQISYFSTVRNSNFIIQTQILCGISSVIAM